MAKTLDVQPLRRPALEANFLPAALWTRAYRALVASDRGVRRFALALTRADGSASRYETRVLGAEHPAAHLNFKYVERLLKFLLWQKGGWR
ncbi:MAG TPA: ROK family protein, partial [Opitutus sp.]|nr:ROK family protein [Opitutus sp.]